MHTKTGIVAVIFAVFCTFSHLAARETIDTAAMHALAGKSGEAATAGGDSSTVKISGKAEGRGGQRTIPEAGSFVVGALVEKTGVAFSNYVPMRRGLDLAALRLNRDGGIRGQRVTIVEFDTMSTPLGSEQAARNAAAANVAAVIGPNWSSLSLAAAPVLQVNRIPMISPVSTHPKVTRIGDYIFRSCYIDTFQGSSLADFVYTDLGARTAAVMVNSNSDYSMGLQTVFSSHFTELGGTVNYVGHYRENALDFSADLAQVRAAAPDVLFVPGYPRDSALVLGQARKMGIEAVFVGADGWGMEMLSHIENDVVEGAFFTNHWHPTVPQPASREMLELARETYKEELIDPLTAMSYDTFMLLADAAVRAKSLDHADIRAALADTKNFQGVSGTISFDEGGDPRKSIVVATFKQGNIVYVKTIEPPQQVQ